MQRSFQWHDFGLIFSALGDLQFSTLRRHKNTRNRKQSLSWGDNQVLNAYTATYLNHGKMIDSLGGRQNCGPAAANYRCALRYWSFERSSIRQYTMRFGSKTVSIDCLAKEQITFNTSPDAEMRRFWHGYVQLSNLQASLSDGDD
jgi:hypothetical protein